MVARDLENASALLTKALDIDEETEDR